METVHGGRVGGAAAGSAIDSLTGLRFIAALSVLVGHAAAGIMTFEPPAPFVHYFTQGPAIGMPLFFVLSGFVIHYNYGSSFRGAFLGPAVDFFIARFARLYPLYLFVLILFILNQRMVWGIFTQQYDLSIFPRYLLLWQAWSIEYRGTTWFGHLLVPPAWSISVEVFFYALYPFLALRILSIRTSRATAWWFVLLVVCYYTTVVLCFNHFDELRRWGNDAFQINADPQNALLGWLLNTGPVVRLAEFMMGVLAAQAYLILRDRPPGRRENLLGSLVLCSMILLAVALYLGTRHSPFLAFAQSYPGGLSPLFAAITFCCARYRNPVERALGAPWMVKLGDASYSIYLMHFFTLQWFHLQVAYPLTSSNIAVWIAQMLGSIAFTILISLGTYRIIEAPSRAYLRRSLHALKKRNVAHWFPDSVALSTPVAIFIVACVVAALAFWNRPREAIIDVVDATYGSSCRSFRPATPLVNLFQAGNATASVRQACAGYQRCLYAINVNVIGDPVPGCPKDFVVTSRCPHDADPRTAALEAEAHGKSLVLECPVARGR